MTRSANSLVVNVTPAGVRAVDLGLRIAFMALTFVSSSSRRLAIPRDRT